MRSDGGRWHEISPSSFVHERAGLEELRQILPDEAPFQAWTNFEFRDSQGKLHEVDALVQARNKLYLVELKHYQGTLSGDDYTWRRAGGSERNPLITANSKAKKLAGVINDWIRRNDATHSLKAPWLAECIYLHAENFRCELPDNARNGLYGQDGSGELTPLSTLLLADLDTKWPQNKLIAADTILHEIFTTIGFARRRSPEVGDWRIIGEAQAQGPDWQDWPVEAKWDEKHRARIRFYPCAPASSPEDTQRHINRIRREFRLTRDLRHPNILSPLAFVHSDHMGPGVVLDAKPDLEDLRMWLSAHHAQLSLEQRISLIRSIAEATQYAHRHNVVHRSLRPGVILVDTQQMRPDGTPTLLITDWHLAGAAQSTADRTTSQSTIYSGALEEDLTAYVAPEGRLLPPGSTKLPLDIFAVGALGYLILTGKEPAPNYTALRDRLRDSQLLDPAVDVGGLPESLRSLIIDATRANVSERQERLGTVAKFIERLDAAEKIVAPIQAEGEFVDVADAHPEDRLNEEFTLVRRLGRGATAFGLLVKNDGGEECVLKVAMDAEHDARLRDEAVVLRTLSALKPKRIVTMLRNEPVMIGGRTALVLSSAGDVTLADELRQRNHLSLDMLERWGTDLLSGLIELSNAGIDHRDIKPANLGFKPVNKARHMVLFDFSLSTTDAHVTSVGTPPYLDPFLGSGRRTTWDSAADRYAVAVTLFQMATGTLITYGDPDSDPEIVQGAPNIDPERFDYSVRSAMQAFFTTALARDAADRHSTAAEMLDAWASIFTPELRTVHDDADAKAARAELTTELAQGGFTPRAISALTALGLHTVADLLAQKLFELRNRLGSDFQTRNEIVERYQQWREKYSSVSRDTFDAGQLADLEEQARTLIDTLPTKGRASRAALSLLLGLDGKGANLDVFGAQSDLYQDFGVKTSAALSLRLTSIRSELDNERAQTILRDVYRNVYATLDAIGGIAPALQLTETMALGVSDGGVRMCRGLVRSALEFALPADDEPHFESSRIRRHDKSGKSRSLVFATNPIAFSILPELGKRCDQLLEEQSGRNELVGSTVVAQQLRAMLPSAFSQMQDLRLIELGADWSHQAGATSRGELYDRSMAAKTRIAVSVGTVSEGQTLTAADIRQRVSDRFPSAEALPPGERFADAVLAAELGLSSTDSKTFHAAPRTTSGTGLSTHISTYSGSDVAQTHTVGYPPQLQQSIAERSFLALAVQAKLVDHYRDVLNQHFNAHLFDVTQHLISLIKDISNGRPSWNAIIRADAAEAGSRDAKGLSVLIAKAIPLLVERIHTEAAACAAESVPLLLVDAAPLAAYGYMNIIGELADITGPPLPAAVWLLVPTNLGGSSPMLDTEPLPLTHNGQLVVLDSQLSITANEVPS